MFFFSQVQRAGFQERPGSPIISRSCSGEGKESCLHPAWEREGCGGMDAPLCTSGLDSPVPSVLMLEPWSGKGAQEAQQQQVCPLLHVHVRARDDVKPSAHSGTKFSYFYLGKFQEGTFSVENQNHCILKGWSFVEKPSSH